MSTFMLINAKATQKYKIAVLTCTFLNRTIFTRNSVDAELTPVALA